MLSQLVPLFGPERLPKRPYCSNEKGYSDIRGVEQALQMRYIQVNPPDLCYRFVFDIDRDSGAYAWEKKPLATPNWVVINPANGHAHIGYELKVPIVMSAKGRSHPIRYADAIKAAYKKEMQADEGFAENKCKNPHHSDWRMLILRSEMYDLNELEEYIDLRQASKDVRSIEDNENEDCNGRNVTLFKKLSKWAYKNVNEHRINRLEGMDDWQCVVQERAEKISSTFAPGDHPFYFSEIRATARSVAKWVWIHFPDKAELAKRFSGLQSARGKSKGKIKREQGLQMLRDNPTLSDSELASTLGVSRQTVWNWRTRL